MELTVGIRDLKSRLSEYMRQVKQGQVILITDHGQPIGRLVPVELSMEERRTHTLENIKRFVTEEEILSVKLELWESFKPKI